MWQDYGLSGFPILKSDCEKFDEKKFKQKPTFGFRGQAAERRPFAIGLTSILREAIT
jgi:hypothetical protein